MSNFSNQFRPYRPDVIVNRIFILCKNILHANFLQGVYA